MVTPLAMARVAATHAETARAPTLVNEGGFPGMMSAALPLIQGEVSMHHAALPPSPLRSGALRSPDRDATERHP